MFNYNNIPIRTGWRVLSKNDGDGTINIIHAGCPESTGIVSGGLEYVRNFRKNFR